MIDEKMIIRVIWGPRPEEPEELALRWVRAHELLAGIDAELLGRWYLGFLEGPVPADDRADLVAQVRAGVVTGTSGRRFPDLGCSFATVNGLSGEREVEFRAHAGLYAAASDQVNLARVEVRPQSAEEVDRWRRMTPEVLLALVEAWQPDAGAAWAHTMAMAQQVAASYPFAGYATYLSAGRCAGLPDGLPGSWRSTPDGGLLNSLLDGAGDLPTVAEVADLGAALREKGALAPVPRDRPAA